MTEHTVDKVQELQDKVEVLERNFQYVKDVLAFEKQRYRDLEREVGRFENNFKYLQGVLDADDRYISELKGLLRSLYNFTIRCCECYGKENQQKAQEVFAQVQKFLGDPSNGK
jgi:chromosome segregation ATPase